MALNRIGLYVHVPYCAKACSYCDFYFKANTTRMPDYLKALLLEAALRLPDGTACRPVHTWYFGGGTPSLLHESDWHLLIPTLRSLYPCRGEFTVEANPDDLTPSYLTMLRYLGVNRLSIGIQSFDNEVLRFMNRRHSAEQAVQAFHDARSAGFTNISLDMMFGIPGCSTQDIMRQIDTACKLRPEHLSVYHLTIEPRTVFGLMNKKGTLSAVSEEESRAQYLAVIQTMADYGYSHYEISNYALPGYASVHNSNYWKSQPYIGFGPSAHSFCGRVRRWNAASTNQYIRGLENQTSDWFETEQLSPTDMYNEYVMTRLRTSEGILPSDISSCFGPDYLAYFNRQAQKYTESGALVQLPDSHVRISEEDWLCSDYIMSDLFFV